VRTGSVACWPGLTRPSCVAGVVVGPDRAFRCDARFGRARPRHHELRVASPALTRPSCFINPRRSRLWVEPDHAASAASDGCAEQTPPLAAPNMPTAASGNTSRTTTASISTSARLFGHRNPAADRLRPARRQHFPHHHEQEAADRAAQTNGRCRNDYRLRHRRLRMGLDRAERGRSIIPFES
jgi:hypothetical protein